MSFWRRPRSTLTGLASVAEVPEDEILHVQSSSTERLLNLEERRHSDIFNNDKTLQLGFPNSHTFLVWTKEGTGSYILQDCAAEDWTDQRAKIAQIARANSALICTHLMFRDNNRVYVASQIADMSLADIIPCSILIDELQVSAIIGQLVHALVEVKAEGIQYNNVTAANVFISRTGVVQLANFQGEEPLGSQTNCKNSVCADLGQLAVYMLSKDPMNNIVAKDQLLQSQRRENMVQMPSGFMIDGNMNLSTDLMEFLDICMKDDLEALKKVGR
ncbi:hypothetical protein N431DRAFT_456582 [Stipitochalara longipes BDJ]|nr:hypothetical protein N431DRAFT_456582 [Stipitochalara longipes BDJ]